MGVTYLQIPAVWGVEEGISKIQDWSEHFSKILSQNKNNIKKLKVGLSTLVKPCLKLKIKFKNWNVTQWLECNSEVSWIGLGEAERERQEKIERDRETEKKLIKMVTKKISKLGNSIKKV